MTSKYVGTTVDELTRKRVKTAGDLYTAERKVIDLAVTGGDLAAPVEEVRRLRAEVARLNVEARREP